jgi:hypothetical protein
MKHGYDLHDIPFDSVGYDVGRPRNDKFTGPFDSTPPTHAWSDDELLDGGSDA